MIEQKIYEADDLMVKVIADNYNILQALGCFGISLGFGDKTIREVCADNNVDTHTFLAVVNFTVNGYHKNDDPDISVHTLMKYLQACHVYYLDFQLPTIRYKLAGALDESNDVAKLILKLYDAYAQEVRLHMKYEEKSLFPYVNSLLAGDPAEEYGIDIFVKHHGQSDVKLRELKRIIIKYIPQDPLRNNQLTSAIYDLYNNEEWLGLHADVEDKIFVPAVRRLESKVRNIDPSRNISNMIFKVDGNSQNLSERERDVIVGLVQGLSNKQIAQQLCISVNTVLTHRRNIARKLEIRSPAGLTIYAIVNGLIDISSAKL